MNEVAVTKDDLDLAYRERNELAAWVARFSGIHAWKGIDPNEPDWPVLYLELPNQGQVSYHYSPRDAHLIENVRIGTFERWDGHTAEERSARLRAAP